jgi:very-long-chain enoyl-CoA reductase
VTVLKKKYHAQNKKAYPARQRLTLPAKEGQKSGDALKDSDTLSKYGLSNGSVVQYKDLGPQVRRWYRLHTH